MASRSDSRDRALPHHLSPGDLRAIHVEDVLRAQEMLEEVDHEAAAEVFAALADPTRLRVVHVLLRQEMCTSDLAAALGLSDPAISQHLRILRNLRLVDCRRAGRMVYYSLRDRRIAKLVGMGLRDHGRGEDSGGRLGRPAPASRPA
jgi:ArsR family transcriptional regulator, lead/cadmium/zinc/bismuth-responsive transcriptional repressor